MPWYSGKTDLVGIAIGDSNMVGFGGFQLGVQTYNPNIRCYATTATIPYDPAELEWRTLDPNGTSREAQVAESLFIQDVTYVGQMLGGNGCAAMEMASVIQQQTECETFWLYTGAKGGARSANYVVGGEPWTSTLAYLPNALADVPGSPTYADFIFISLCANDIFDGVTAEQFYQNVVTIRDQMIGEGWWVPGDTQIVFMDTPPNLNPTWWPDAETWAGVQYARTRLNDRVSYVSNVGTEIQDTGEFSVHYIPSSLTSIGHNAGNQVFNQIPWQQSVFSVGGSRLSIGGQKLRVHAQ